MSYYKYLPREVFGDLVQINAVQHLCRHYMVRNSRGTFAYIWEIYNGASYTIYLPVNTSFEVKLYQYDPNEYKLYRRTYLQFKQYFETNISMQIDVILGEGSTTISIDQKDKRAIVFCGDNFGSQYIIPKEHYDDFVHWIRYVLELWNEDGIVN